MATADRGRRPVELVPTTRKHDRSSKGSGGLAAPVAILLQPQARILRALPNAGIRFPMADGPRFFRRRLKISPDRVLYCDELDRGGAFTWLIRLPSLSWLRPGLQ